MEFWLFIIQLHSVYALNVSCVLRPKSQTFIVNVIFAAYFKCHLIAFDEQNTAKLNLDRILKINTGKKSTEKCKILFYHIRHSSKASKFYN